MQTYIRTQHIQRTLNNASIHTCNRTKQITLYTYMHIQMQVYKDAHTHKSTTLHTQKYESRRRRKNTHNMTM